MSSARRASGAASASARRDTPLGHSSAAGPSACHRVNAPTPRALSSSNVLYRSKTGYFTSLRA
jgi:hypothetical protein